MIQCEKCDNWQHLFCCGFENNDDARLKNPYYCLDCLRKEDPKKYAAEPAKFTGLNHPSFSLCSKEWKAKA